MHPLHRSYAQLLKKLPVQEKTKMPYNQTPDHPRQISPDKYIQLAYLPVKRISNHRKGGNDTPAKTAASYALKETNVSMILTMGSRQGAVPRIRDLRRTLHRPVFRSDLCTIFETSRPLRRLFQRRRPRCLRRQLEACERNNMRIKGVIIWYKKRA